MVRERASQVIMAYPHVPVHEQTEVSGIEYHVIH